MGTSIDIIQVLGAQQPPHPKDLQGELQLMISVGGRNYRFFATAQTIAQLVQDGNGAAIVFPSEEAFSHFSMLVHKTVAEMVRTHVTIAK